MNSETHYRPGTTQTVSYTGTAGTISNAVGDQTRTVRIRCTTGAFVAFGGSPTATTSDMPVEANVPEYFRISPGEKVSAIRESADGDLYVTEMTL